MGKTSIEWTDASWNPIVGCTEISPGCANCYAARLAGTRLKTTPAYRGLAKIDLSLPKKYGTDPRWNGEVRFLPERLKEPLHWKKPRKIFVCDMGDLFHESVTHEQLKIVFATIALGQQHTFQVLTKRPARMREFLSHPDMRILHRWPLKNLWLGVSVENQHFADERIPLLLETPAAVRWISAEPLLGPIGIGKVHHCADINWVVCGGESGPGARPMHPDWARSLRDQCQAAGVPFFFKQWGEWLPTTEFTALKEFYSRIGATLKLDGSEVEWRKVGKQRAGRLLDGREWNQYPTKDTDPGANRDEFPQVNS